jgi:TfoX/Sxy family transcriptional regulator of competence genes
MKKIAFNPEHKRVLDAMLLTIADVRAGKMFGYPGYYVDRKLFACVIGDAVAIKLPEATVRALLEAEPAEIEPFRPMGGRIMKEWVQIRRRNSECYRADAEILRDSVDFVTAPSRSKRKQARPR